LLPEPESEPELLLPLQEKVEPWLEPPLLPLNDELWLEPPPLLDELELWLDPLLKEWLPLLKLELCDEEECEE